MEDRHQIMVLLETRVRGEQGGTLLYTLSLLFKFLITYLIKKKRAISQND